MSQRIRDLADRCKEECLAGRDQGKATVVELLSVDPRSEDALYIRSAANDVTRAVTGRRGWVTFSIGVDFVREDASRWLHDERERRPRHRRRLGGTMR